jgi:hypothetical protein
MDSFIPTRRLEVARLGAALAALVLAAPGRAEGPLSQHEQTILRNAKQLLPDVIDLAHAITRSTALERRTAEYISIALEKDEYVYHAPDRLFIRCIKDRFELPAWRLCGDFALIRVELMDDAMKTVGPVMGWHMVYREGRWQRLFQNEEFFSFSDGQPVEIPPYAARCFNLDRRELLDR